MTAPIRDAATVALLRDGPVGIEAWLLTRVRQLAFAAGMSVFPGGRVDDGDAGLPFAAGAGREVAARFECDERTALALLGAAVRETFEETGVLLTSPRADLSAARADVEAGRVGLGGLLAEQGLTVDASGLRPWARWVTPPGEARRYDARFFVAALPAGAEPKAVTTEASGAGWVPVTEALTQFERGERGLLPPTIVTLAAVATFDSVADVLAAAPAQSLAAVSPAIHIEDGRVVAELPDGSWYELPRTMFR